jgi:chemotaxis signal transduction protein
MKELILINLGGNRYGVWKDDVLSVRDVDGIHGIPMSTALFSGTAGIEGRTANLLDLAACLGHKPFDRKRPGRVLVMSEREYIGGFVFDSESGRIEAPPESVLPMPGCLESPEVTECVCDSGETVPVINIGLLYKRIRKKRWGPCVFSFPRSAPRGSKPLSGVFRAFTIDGEAFAVPDESVERGAEEPGRIHPLPTTPPHVQGVVFKDGGVRVVIDLARYIGKEGFSERGRMILAKGGSLAFLVDEDMGRLKEKVPHSPMPRIAASGFIGHALVWKGKVVPLLDVHASVSRNPAKAFSRKYAPRSRFQDSFGKKEARVHEFVLNGLRQSVPDSQVEDVVGVKPWRELRGVHPMMSGVVEHGGELLPVLDLSACFGKRTEVGQGAKMMLIKNGNFRALVLVEAVMGRKTLAVSEQRTLPIRLPHLYVYGCYTHDNSVRLILNVEALTSHFDEKLVGEYLEMLSKEIVSADALPGGPETTHKASAAVAVPGAHSAKADAAPAASSGEAEGEDALAEPGEEAVPESVAPPDEEEREEEPVKEDAEAGADAAAPVASFGEAQGEDALVKPGEEEVSEPTASFADEKRGGEPSEEEAGLESGSEDVPESVAPPGEEEREEEPVKEDAGAPLASFGEAEGEDTLAEPGEKDVPESVAPPGEEKREEEPVKEDEGPETGADAATPAAFFGKTEATGDDTLAEPGAEKIPEPAASLGDAGQGGEPAEEGTGENVVETIVSYEGTELVKQPSEEQGNASPGQAAADKIVADVSPGTFVSLDEPGDEEERKGEAPPPSGEYPEASPKSKSGTYAGLVLILLFAILMLAYFGGKGTKRAGEETASLADTREAREEAVLPEEKVASREPEGEALPQESGDEISPPYEEPVSGPERSPAEPAKPVKTVRTGPVRERRASLLMELGPENGEIAMRAVDASPPDAKVYEVVKGDTLWHIARRFTGNPFNYPRIARDSDIKNPDLIFPGQKVLIRIREEG